MLKEIQQVFQSLGIEEIQIGNEKLSIGKPKTKNKIEGFGETIEVGDVFFEKMHEGNIGNFKKNDLLKDDWAGPYKLLAVSDNDADPWYRFMNSEGGAPSGLYFYKDERKKFPNWQREFKLADKESATKLNNALKYKDLFVRIYVNFNNGIPNRPVLIPACWIVWQNNFLKACQTYSRPYGLLKKKNIVKHIKNKMFKSIRMDSKVPIPEDFPVDISDLH